MIHASPEMRDFIGRVIALEMNECVTSGSATPVAFIVCEKLRPQWANLMGTIGFRTLLARALKVACAEVPWLCAVQVRADGSLEAAGEMDGCMDANVMAAGSEVLVIELLALLGEFIGETLALRLMHDMWPQLPFDDSDSHNGKK